MVDLTIVTPLYRRTDFLGNYFNAWTRQKSSDLKIEFCFTDDCSEPSLESVIQVFWKQYNTNFPFTATARYQRNERNLGEYANTNAGIRAASGKWIMILHDDDHVLPGWLGTIEQVLKQADQHGINVCSYGYVNLNLKNKVVFRSNAWFDTPTIVPRANLHQRFSVGNPLHPCAMIFRKSLFETVGPLDESIRYFADWEFCRRIVYRSSGWLACPQTLAAYRQESLDSESNKRDAAASDHAVHRLRLIQRGYTYAPTQSVDQMLERFVQDIRRRGRESRHISTRVQCFPEGELTNDQQQYLEKLTTTSQPFDVMTSKRFANVTLEPVHARFNELSAEDKRRYMCLYCMLHHGGVFTDLTSPPECGWDILFRIFQQTNATVIATADPSGFNVICRPELGFTRKLYDNMCKRLSKGDTNAVKEWRSEIVRVLIETGQCRKININGGKSFKVWTFTFAFYPYQVLNLNQFMNDKKVVIVGPAPYLHTKMIGEVIDSYDTVVRLNKGHKLIQTPEVFGSRTDVLYHCVCQEETNGGKISLDMYNEVECICTSYPILYAQDKTSFANGNAHQFTSFYFEGKDKITLINKQFYIKLEKEIGCRPTTGIVSILDILMNYHPKELYITGITFFKDGYSKHYRSDETNEKSSNVGALEKMMRQTYKGRHNQWLLFKYFRNVMKRYKHIVKMDQILLDMLTFDLNRYREHHNLLDKNDEEVFCHYLIH